MNEAAQVIPSANLMPPPDGGAASRLAPAQQDRGGEGFAGVLREQRSVTESAAGTRSGGGAAERRSGQARPPSGNDLPEAGSSTATAAADTSGAATAVAAEGSVESTAAKAAAPGTGTEVAPPVVSPSADVGGAGPGAELELASSAMLVQPLFAGQVAGSAAPERARTPASATAAGDGATRGTPFGLAGRAATGVFAGLAERTTTGAPAAVDAARRDTPPSPVVAQARSQGAVSNGEVVLTAPRPLSAEARLALARAGLFTAEGAANRTAESRGASLSGASVRPAPVSPLVVAGQPSVAPATQNVPAAGLLQPGVTGPLFGRSESGDGSALTGSGTGAVGGEFSSVLQGGLATGAIRPGAVAGGTPVLNVATYAGQAGWASEVGQRVTWMVGNQLREAQLQLHPRSLGPVEVRITFGAEQQLTVNFSAANPVAREALEAALPRLREMFDQQGLNLGQADVSRESFAGRQQRREQGDALAAGRVPGSEPVDDDDGLAAGLAGPVVNVSEGLLDAYA